MKTTTTTETRQESSENRVMITRLRNAAVNITMGADGANGDPVNRCGRS